MAKETIINVLTGEVTMNPDYSAISEDGPVPRTSLATSIVMQMLIDIDRWIRLTPLWRLNPSILQDGLRPITQSSIAMIKTLSPSSRRSDSIRLKSSHLRRGDRSWPAS